MCRGENNGLSFGNSNKVFKDNYTFRNRMKVSEFCSLVKTTLKDMSLEKKRGEKIFQKKTTITLQQWTAGYNFKRMKKTLRCMGNHKGYTIFIVPAGAQLKISEKRFDMYNNRSWKTFESFEQNYNQFYVVKVNQNADPSNDLWRDGECSCPAFMKNYICKHLIGLSLRKNLLDPVLMPLAAKAIPLGERRKPGRPALAKPALVMQQGSKMHKDKTTGQRNKKQSKK